MASAKRKTGEGESEMRQKKKHRWSKEKLDILAKYFPPEGETRNDGCEGEIDLDKQHENQIAKCATQLGIPKEIVEVCTVHVGPAQ